MADRKRFVIADLHLGHKGVTEFLREDGSKLRPWTDVDKMTEDMIEYWNDTVKDGDRVYILGDFVINRRYLPLAGRLHGSKVLVKGNHDIFKLKEYLPYFEDIRACVVGKGYILTHIPIHPDQCERFGRNIHGHLHARVVGDKYMDLFTYTVEQRPDPRYKCVSVEHTNYRPVLLDTVLNGG